jgi:hypothetical protein
VTIHLLAAIIWLGGGFMIAVEGERAERAKNEDEMVAIAISADSWSTHLFIPVTLVLLLCGFGMIGTGHPGFSHPFIDVGLAGWAVSFAIGAGLPGPLSGHVKKLATAHSGPTPEIVARVDRILLVARVDMVILLAIAAVMVIPPGGGV